MVVFDFQAGFYRTYTGKAVLLCEFEERLFAIDEVGGGKGLL